MPTGRVEFLHVNQFTFSIDGVTENHVHKIDGLHQSVEVAEYRYGDRFERGLQAARLGPSTDGAHCYTTLRPCFGCLKELHQAGVTTVRFLNPWEPREAAERDAYHALLDELARHGVEVSPLALDAALLDLAPAARA